MIHNVTVAVYENAKPVYLERVEAGLGRIVVACAEKRRRVMRGHYWSGRVVRKRLSRRERGRKLDILREDR